MPDSLQVVLQESVQEVLEKMFFIRSLGEASGENVASENEMWARMTFEGEPSGFLTLCVAGEAARSISADFLGVEEEGLSRQEVGDVVCELANMICGSVLSRVESAVTFRLARPELSCRAVEGGAAPEPARQGAVHSVRISGGRLIATVQTEPIGRCRASEPASSCRAGESVVWTGEKRES